MSSGSGPRDRGLGIDGAALDATTFIFSASGAPASLGITYPPRPRSFFTPRSAPALIQRRTVF